MMFILIDPMKTISPLYSATLEYWQGIHRQQQWDSNTSTGFEENRVRMKSHRDRGSNRAMEEPHWTMDEIKILAGAADYT